MKTNFKLPLMILALASLTGLARAQGTAFSYQGRLDDSGLPATGLYDFTFNVFDVNASGVALTGTLPLNAVLVTNGLFNVILDFGAGIFTGPSRWLEITVRTNGVGVPDVLAPRTLLLPTPYSIFAGKAAGVVNGSVTANQLNVAGAPPTAGQFLSYDGGNFHWSDPGVAVGNIWSLNGSSAYYNAGNAGLGTTTPAHRLGIGNNLPAWTANGWGGAIELWNAAAIGWRSNAGGQRFGIGSSGGGLYFFRTASDPGTTGSSALYDMIISDAGRVGIGTITPTAKLTVRTTGAFSAYGIEHTDGTVRLSTYLDAGYGAWLGTRSAHGLNFYVNDGLPSLALDTTGNTIITPNGGVGGYGSTIFGAPNGESGMSIRGGNRADIRFNGSSLKLVAASGVGPPPAENGLLITTAGRVGIGSATPQSKLEVVGQDALRLVGYQPFLTLMDDSASYARSRIQGVNGELFFATESYMNGSVPYAWAKLNNAGNMSVATLTIRGGADLAEPFPMKEEQIEKGSVVIIDDEHAGRLKRSTQAYDTRVAGIVSGANGVNPGISLKQEGTLDQGENVALTGRVYVQADASFGAIKPGDLLTTSDTPGHAMKVTNRARAQGAILGKAMSALKEGKGMVLVIVTLQ